jgi:hypothetical protein
VVINKRSLMFLSPFEFGSTSKRENNLPTAALFLCARHHVISPKWNSSLRGCPRSPPLKPLERKWAARLEPEGSYFDESGGTMRRLAITLLAGVGALSVGSAKASDIYTSSTYINPDLVQPVGMVCNDDGRCYRSRGGSRVIIRDSYNYAPRERYIERRTYRDWDDGPRAGVGFRAPGVSVGVGVGNDRW